MTTDDDGHTALHWACAMGRVRLVKLLPFTGLGHLQRSTQADQTVPSATTTISTSSPNSSKSLHRSVVNIESAGPYRFSTTSSTLLSAEASRMPRDTTSRRCAIDSPNTPHNSPISLTTRRRLRSDRENR
ncbi:hypothetical protein CF326_g9536 [Tilletia indica]|nr:hypothetical protein CF326_g9536 [Tilletia indica]